LLFSPWSSRHEAMMKKACPQAPPLKWRAEHGLSNQIRLLYKGASGKHTFRLRCLPFECATHLLNSKSISTMLYACSTPWTSSGYSR